MFLSRNKKKKKYTPVNSSFIIYMWRLRVSKLYRYVFVMSAIFFYLHTLILWYFIGWGRVTLCEWNNYFAYLNRERRFVACKIDLIPPHFVLFLVYYAAVIMVFVILAAHCLARFFVSCLIFVCHVWNRKLYILIFRCFCVVVFLIFLFVSLVKWRICFCGCDANNIYIAA